MYHSLSCVSIFGKNNVPILQNMTSAIIGTGVYFINTKMIACSGMALVLA